MACKRGRKAKAFKRDNPLTPININKVRNNQREQEGFVHLTVDAMAGLRNLYSHGDVDRMSVADAIDDWASPACSPSGLSGLFSKKRSQRSHDDSTTAGQLQGLR